MSAAESYRGERAADGACRVEAVGADGARRPLDPRLDLRDHSPDGFEWGYEGSGPAQLALALLADALGDDARAARLYQAFKRRFVAKLGPAEVWVVSAEAVRAIAGEIERAGGA